MRPLASMLLCGVLLLMLPVASSAAGLPGLLTNQVIHHRFQVRPAFVSYTGDGAGFVGGFDGTGRAEGHRGNFGHVTWLTWTNQLATGTGALWGDDCEPNCAQGSFSPVPVKVRAFAPRHGHFTRMTLRYEREGEKFIDERGVKFYKSVVPGVPGYYDYFIVRQVHEYVAPAE